MKTEIKIILLCMIVVTAVLCWDSIAAYFRDMTPMQIVEFFWMVTVKATVLAICAWLASTVPHIVRPWIKMAKRISRRQSWRPGPNAQWESQTPRMPRMTAEQKFMLLLARMQQNGQMRQPRPPAMPMQNLQDPELRIKF